MSADPIGVPTLGQHGMSFLEDEPLLSQHGMGPSMGSAIVETAPVHDPDADFWFDGGAAFDVGDDDLGRRIEQTLQDAHGLTGQDEVVNTYGFDGSGQTVAVIDTGIAYGHYALGGGLGEGYRVVGGWDFTENDADFYDDGPEGGHGSHVAGIVGAGGGGVHQGVATDVDLVGLRVFDDAGNGYFSWVEQALQWVHTNRNAYDNPITAVNLSLGTEWNSDSIPGWAMLEDEFAQLEADGIFISVSAGNSFTNYNTPGVSYPAASDYVIPVMSVDNDGNLSYFSQRAEYAIAAPGRWITSTVPDYVAGDADTIDDDWVSMSGTSMAAPYVAGASVLIREAMEFVGQTGITQDTIYDHMMATADTFYDSATSANYKRLNLQAAIDALMPEDDYGSSTIDAYNLGTLNDSEGAPQSLVSGVISTLDDGDFFSFTAGATGTVTVTASGVTHDLVEQWDVWGGEWNDAGNGQCTIDVVAGQTYTFALSSSVGLGYYDLSLNLESSFAAIDWGSVGIQETRSGLNVSGESWYSVTVGRTGYFTAESLVNSGSATVAIYDSGQNLLVAAGSRADYQATAGQQLLLRVAGTSSDFDLRMTNAVSQTGSVVDVIGTSGDDTLTFAAGVNTITPSFGVTPHTVSINGVSYEFDVNAANTFNLDGGSGGYDRIYLTGSAGDDFATLDGSTARISGTVGFEGATFTASGDTAEYLSINGGPGGNDQVQIQDTAGNDTITFRPEANDAYMSAGGVFSYASGFDSVSALATNGGFDTVNFNDTAGDDTINFRPEENDAYMNAGGIFCYASGFDRVNAYSTNGGYDKAVFNDTSGSDTINFRPEENDAYMNAGGVFSYASGFDRVNAYSTNGGYDTVVFNDTSGSDNIYFRPEEDDTYMSAGGVFSYAKGFDRVNAYSTNGGYDAVSFADTSGDDNIYFRPEEDDAYMNAGGVFSYAKGFDRVNAYATSGGYDRVHFNDTSSNDTIYFRPGENDAYMSAGGVFSYAIGFDRVDAYSTNGGYDTVNFNDTAGSDNIYFRPNENDAYMSAGGVFSYANGFDRVNAYSTLGGYDAVHFYDTTGADTVYMRPGQNDAYMSAGGIFSYALGFDRVNAYSTNGGYDRVVFSDTSGSDTFTGRASTGDAFMSGSGYFNYAIGFDSYEATGGSGGYDRAVLNDSSGDDDLTASGSNATLTAVDAAFSATGFDRVEAHSLEGGTDTVTEGTIDYVLDKTGAWT